MKEERFPLAPMSRDLLVLTCVLLPLPLVLAAAAVSAPRGPNAVLEAVSLFVAVTYLSVWLFWRPSRFEVSEAGLRIVWPLRQRRLPPAEIGAASLLDRGAFRDDYGQGIRVGAGGLWGGFGLLLTKRGTLSMYVSRTDRFVLANIVGDRPLLITPARPERFVAAISELRTPPPTSTRS